MSSAAACDPCRLIVDPPANGAWNMAIDEELLERAATAELPTLRIYRWLQPTLSLGYFQSYADRQSHSASLAAKVVRRLSGGGAIMHDQEITYSLTLPAHHPLASKTQQLYDAVHQAIVAWLSEFKKISSSRWRLALCDGRSQKTNRQEPFLCFLRRSSGDVLLTDKHDDTVSHKIVGSAQRRRRGGVLQHGSILCTTSECAPEIHGLTNLTGESVSLETAVGDLSSRILAGLRLSGENRSHDDDFLASASQRIDQRYDLSAWTERR